MNVEFTNDEDKLYEMQVERRNRFLNVVTVVPAVLGLLLFMVLLSIDPKYIESMININIRFIWIFDIAMITLSGMSLIMRYLQTGFVVDKQKQIEELKINQEHYRERNLHKESELLKIELEDYERKFDEINSKIENISASHSALDVSEVIDSVKEKVLSDSSNEILNDILQQARKTSEKEVNANELRHNLKVCIERIRSEIEKLRWRGNFNLSIGAVVTLLGLALLGYFVFLDSKETTEMWQFISHYLPRLSLVIFIELFAFFFLRLYKASLDEIKYFQNEITNVESKLIAVQLSLSSKENAGLETIIETLANTERNFVLEKGQTTVDLERSRMEKETITSLSNNLVTAMSSKP